MRKEVDSKERRWGEIEGRERGREGERKGERR